MNHNDGIIGYFASRIDGLWSVTVYLEDGGEHTFTMMHEGEQIDPAVVSVKIQELLNKREA